VDALRAPSDVPLPRPPAPRPQRVDASRIAWRFSAVLCNHASVIARTSTQILPLDELAFVDPA